MEQVDAIEIENWIAARVAELVNIDPSAVARDDKFDSYGIDSAKAIALMIDLEEWLQLPDELPLEILFEADSIREAAASIAAVARADGQIQTVVISNDR